jgi:hypothetical protein
VNGPAEVAGRRRRAGLPGYTTPRPSGDVVFLLLPISCRLPEPDPVQQDQPPTSAELLALSDERFFRSPERLFVVMGMGIGSLGLARRSCSTTR